jgi:single-strand DNA-binding protein
MNRVSVQGNLGKDPERIGKIVVFSIADNRRAKDQSGEWIDVTQWLDVKCFGKNADKVEAGLKKGDSVHLSGRLEIEKWEDKEGNKRSKAVIIPDNFNGVLKVTYLSLPVNAEMPTQAASNFDDLGF